MEQQTDSRSVSLSQGRGGILGVKAGMTQIYGENGDSIAVTVIHLQPNVITQLKTEEKNGYSAVQVGLNPKKAKSCTKAEQGHHKAVGQPGFSHRQEFRLPKGTPMDAFKVGQVLSADFIQVGDVIDLTSVSKGKGFQGVMKRYNYAGGPKSHGASVCHRSIGSIGNRADPGKVFKGKPMAGRMGHEKVTVQNVKVVRVDTDNQVLLVHGSVPGPKTGIVTIRRAVKGSK